MMPYNKKQTVSTVCVCVWRGGDRDWGGNEC